MCPHSHVLLQRSGVFDCIYRLKIHRFVNRIVVIWSIDPLPKSRAHHEFHISQHLQRAISAPLIPFATAFCEYCSNLLSLESTAQLAAMIALARIGANSFPSTLFFISCV
jgi:hypothetical protein